MLHIILAILKIIGILLAVVLGLLVLGVLLILFVPLRYQLDFERGTGSNLARGRFGWLARLIMVTVKLEDNKPYVTVRICGFTKQLVPAAEKKEKPPGKRKKSKTSEDSEDGEYDSGPGQDQEPPADKKRLPEKETSKPENAPKEESVPEKPKEVKAVLTKEPEKEEDVKSGQIGSSAERPGPLEKIKRLYNKVKTAVLKIYGILVHIPEIPGKLLKKWQGIQNKAEAVRKKAEHYISIWKDEGTQAVFMLSKDQIRFLWKHLHPRKIQGKLRYGFEDPSITGMVTGGLYIILPMSFYEVELLPEFEPDKPLILEGKLLIKGHVRLCHVAKTVWILFRNKDLRKLIKQLKA